MQVCVPCFYIPYHFQPLIFDLRLSTLNYKLSTKICIYAFFFVSLQANLYSYTN